MPHSVVSGNRRPYMPDCRRCKWDLRLLSEQTTVGSPELSQQVSGTSVSENLNFLMFAQEISCWELLTQLWGVCRQETRFLKADRSVQVWCLLIQGCHCQSYFPITLVKIFWDLKRFQFSSVTRFNWLCYKSKHSPAKRIQAEQVTLIKIPFR